MADLSNNEHYPLSDAPPMIHVTGDTPATTERPDPIIAPQDLRRHQTADATVEAAYRTTSALIVDPAASEDVADTEDKLNTRFGIVNDVYEKLNEYCAAHPSVFNHAINVLESYTDLKSFDSTFAEVSKVLVDGVNLLGELHPFVKVVVSPLRLILTFDLTRRQNSKKVTAVKMQILDTATVLFRLRGVHEAEIKGPDGMPLSDIVDVVQRIANDIQECASACDLYLNKNAFSKMLRAKDYEERFGSFIKKFNGHQRSLTLVLSAHTAIVVDTMNDKLDLHGQGLKTIEYKIDGLFRMLDTTREREVQKFIAAKGGAKACVESDVILKELADKSGESLESLVPTRSGKGDGATTKKLLEDVRRVLNKELAEDVDQAFNKHMEDFDPKLKAGLHSKIKDRDLQKLWEQQRWKGSVYARDFVLALNEYFFAELEHGHSKPVQSAANLSAHSLAGSPTSSVREYHWHEAEKHEGDQWAIAYINLAHLQPLLDVIDTDGSGLISIAEANHFARLRPDGWSLIHWFAFWAAGWHLTVTWYRCRIYNILVAMLGLVHRVKPANIQAADTYLAGWGIQRVELLLRATRSAEPEYMYRDDTELKNLAREFHTLEEAKLKSQLEQLHYKLDNIDTLQLVTGARSSGLRRIEVHVYPLLYLLLLRHLAIMQLACVHNLHEDEFPTMSTSLITIFEAVHYRTNRLAGMFKSNAKDGQEGFTDFAFGMFEQLYRYRDWDQRDAKHNTIHNRQDEENDGLEVPLALGPNPDDDEESAMAFFAIIDPCILLNKIAGEPIRLHDPQTQLSRTALTDSDPLDGMWTGQLFFPDGSVPYGTLSMQLTRTTDNFTGVAENSTGLLTVAGTGSGYRVKCKGPYAPWADTITGLWEPKMEDSEEDLDRTNNAPTRPKISLRFVFRRPPSFRFTDGANRANARWEVAIAATINMVGPTALRKARAQMQWAWLADRLVERRRFVNLAKRERADWDGLSTPWKMLDDGEAAELQRLKIDLRPCDARVYASLAESELQQLVDHGRRCDFCHQSIRGIRCFCIQCIDDKYDDGIDLCSECRDQTPVVHRLGFTHTSFHSPVKTTRRIHDGDLARIIPKTKVVAEQVKERSKATQAPPLRIDGPPQPSSYAIASKSQVEQQQFHCCYCEKPISLPFWACVECVEDTYVCLDCDAKGSALADYGPFCLDLMPGSGPHDARLNPKHKPGCCPHAARRNSKHKLFHALVHLVEDESVAEPEVMNVTLAEMMAKLLEMEKKMTAVDEKLERFLSQTYRKNE
ncbi:hypothetical protein B0H19DRAFT_1232478 [Mycena capillaripes]|nr:hypothetical protein B0H19DRAFT_1232478 [Mycena capillaripes]